MIPNDDKKAKPSDSSESVKEKFGGVSSSKLNKSRSVSGLFVYRNELICESGSPINFGKTLIFSFIFFSHTELHDGQG